MEKAWGLSIIAALSDNPSQIFGFVDTLSLNESSLNEFLSSTMSPFWRVFYLEDDISGYRSILDRRINSLSLPYYDYSNVVMKSFQSTEKTNMGLLSSIITPSIDRVTPRATHADAQYKILLVASAVVMYQSANEKYPEKYSDLFPECLDRMALDPFDGQMIRLAARGKGVIVYSVGENLKDDNGDTSTQENSTIPKDIIIRVGTE